MGKRICFSNFSFDCSIFCNRAELIFLSFLLGFIIYFTYGIRNSVEGTPKQDANDNDFILQGTPDIEQDMHEVQPSQVSEDKQPLTSSLGDQQ